MTPDGVPGALGVPADEASPAETPKSQGSMRRNSLPSLYHTDRFENRFRSPYVPTTAEPCEINFLESTEDVMNVNDEPEFMDIEVALDSACGAHVADRVDLPNYAVEESEGSRRGQNFTAAFGKSTANEGQTTVALLTAEDSKLDTEILSTFQIAAVTRPLWSLSEIMDNLPEDHDARFTRKFAHVRDGHGTPIALFERKGGLYVSRMRLRNPKHPTFRRQA